MFRSHWQKLLAARCTEVGERSKPRFSKSCAFSDMPVLKPVACAQDQDSNSVSHSAMLGSTQNQRVAMVRLPWGPRRWAFWDSISIYFGVMISLSQVSQFLSSYIWLVSCLHLGRIIGGLIGTKLYVNHFLQMGRRKWKRVYTCVYYLLPAFA